MAITETDKTEQERFDAWFSAAYPSAVAEPWPDTWEAWQARAALDAGVVTEGQNMALDKTTIVAILRQHIKVDATGLAPAIVSHYMYGFDAAAEAILAAATQPPASADDDIDLCPVCADPIRKGDTYATDIEMGTCHAACLEGSPVVDLETGEPSEGPVTTFVLEAEQPLAPDSAEPLTFYYRNWRGETSVRLAWPQKVYFGSTEWHPEPQWIMRALDADKGDVRDFAMQDMGPRPASAGKAGLEEVGTTPRGYTIFREPNDVGGYRYWSDEIGGGVMVWDTCLGAPETLLECLRIEGVASAGKVEPVAWRVRVASNDPEEWSLLPAGGGADYIGRKGYEAQPLYTAPPAHPDARQAAEEMRAKAAALIEDHTISFGNTNMLRPRLDGDRAGLEYAAAIRALPLPGDKVER